MQLRSQRSTTNTAGPVPEIGTAPVKLPFRGAAGSNTASLPPLTDGRPKMRPVSTSRELADELEGMAATVAEVDPRAAERLGDLSQSVDTEEGRIRWADVDLRRAFNTERIAHAWAVRHEGTFASASIERADRLRNILVLVPILLTWAALAEASRAYAKYIAEVPEAVDQPFLLLWQRGFGGHASPFSPTFATVAIIDAAVIAVIILLTFYVHGQREKREDKIADTASGFQTDLDNVLASATVALASDRASRPALLANSVERLADRFEQSSQELLTRLQLEHDRLAAIAGRREKEFADFGVFASGMRAGAEETHRLLIDLRQVSGGLQAAIEDLTGEVGLAGDHQRTLLTVVNNLERLVSSGIQSDQAVTRQLTAAANSLSDAADKALSGAETAAQAGRVASEAVRGIAELTAALSASQQRVEEAVANEADANARLADSLRGNTGGIAASTKTLNEIGAGLAQLRGEFSRIASQSAEQSATLGNLLAEQTSVASGLSQVARDLSAVGIATAQRQREVNEDLSILLNRLDGLTNLLARATASTPTAEAMQQAFASALRNELASRSDGYASTFDPITGVSSEPDVNRDRGLWPQRPRRP